MSNRIQFSFLVSAFTICCLVADKTIPEPNAVLDTIAQMDHVNWVMTKIKNYNNALVPEEEHKKIFPGMLNLNDSRQEDSREDYCSFGRTSCHAEVGA